MKKKRSEKCYRCVSIDTMKCVSCEKVVCHWHQMGHKCYFEKWVKVND